MTYTPKKSRLTFAAAAILLCAALPARAGAAQEFRPYGDYMLVVDGQEVPNAEIYFSQTLPGFLVLTSKLEAPVLVSVSSQTVETVQLMKVAKQKDGTVDLLAGATLAPQGSFTVAGEGKEVSFKVDRHAVQLRTRPFLLGLHAASELKAFNPPIYVEGARLYRPDNQMIAALKRAPTPVTVRVFFGSWCPHCQHIVPQVLKIEDELKGSKIHFEYFGLPREGMANVPEAKKFGINGVPTGIVFVKGKEVGRLTSGSAWASPETSLATILNGAAADR